MKKEYGRLDVYLGENVYVKGIVVYILQCSMPDWWCAGILAPEAPTERHIVSI